MKPPRQHPVQTQYIPDIRHTFYQVEHQYASRRPRIHASLYKRATVGLVNTDDLAEITAETRPANGSAAVATASTGTPIRKPIRNAAFEAALTEVQRRLDNLNEIKNEFRRVQWRAGSNRKCTIAEKPESRACNRYVDCLPFDFNRVILFREEDQDTGYINASLLESPAEDKPDWHYIIAQGPLSNTTVDFWEMIWMKDCPLIIMLTDLEEMDLQGNVRIQSDQYWPPCVGGMSVYKRILVSLVSKEKVAPDIIKRTFKLANIYLIEKELYVDQYQFTGWKDVDVASPKICGSVRQLLSILDRSECILKGTQRPPPVIHCNSGIGRSMAFVAMSIALTKLRYLKPSDRQAAREAVDMYGGLIALRKLRNSAVHSEQLLHFIYQVLADEIKDMLVIND